MRSEQAVFAALHQFRNNKILVQSDVTQQKMFILQAVTYSFKTIACTKKIKKVITLATVNKHYLDYLISHKIALRQVKTVDCWDVTRTVKALSTRDIEV